MPHDHPLSPTARTTLNRSRERARHDRDELYALLREALICHLGFVADGAPVVLPTCFGVDLDGPDDGGTVYVHGSVATRSLASTDREPVCLTFTLLDGLVLARSGFNHSMNYRSAVVMGTARVVRDADERDHALALIVDQIVPGRSATLRPHSRKELAATGVIAVPLAEASVKMRSGGPHDDPEDVATGAWAGVLPLRLVADDLVRSDDAEGDPPRDVVVRALGLRTPRT